MPIRFQHPGPLALPSHQRRDCPELELLSTNPPLLPSQLCALPTELVEHIAAELRPPDLYSLRVTCKTLSQKTLHYFGFTHLASIQTNLSPSSLQALDRLSRKELGRYVQTLVVRGPGFIGRGFSWNRTSSGRLIFPHPCVQTLQEAILKLVNCRSFQIQQHHGHENSCELGQLTPSDTIAIILHIIAETSLPVKSFAVDFNTGGIGEVDIRRLDLATYQKPEFRSAWAQLQELSLRKMIGQGNLEWVLGILVGASNLRTLVLNFRRDDSNVFFSRALFRNKLPKLEELHLSLAAVENDAFFKFLFCFKQSLRVLRFELCNLETGGTWKSVFERLKTELSALESITVDRLTEKDLDEVFLPRKRVNFPSLREDPSFRGRGADDLRSLETGGGVGRRGYLGLATRAQIWARR